MLQEKAKLQENLRKFILGFKCEDPKAGMFCTLCKKWGGYLQVQKVGGGQGELLTGTMPQKLLKQHSGYKQQQASPITARMAKHVEQQNAMEMQCAGAANKLKSKRKRIVRLFLN